MRLTTTIALLALLAGCGERGNAPTRPDGTTGSEEPGNAPASTLSWDLQSSGEGAALVLATSAGGPVLRLFCPAGGKPMVVNVRAFQPVGSEERMTIGSGGTVVTLVAGSTGDAQRGGVSASGPVPTELRQILSAPISVNYGAQTSGPHAAPPAQMADMLVAACGEGSGSPAPQATPVNEPPAVQSPGACREQDGKTLAANRLRAVGTEPFWGARIEGRCVTYSHPDDQDGTRVWTQFAGTAESGSWSGNLGGRPFVLRTRPQSGCSDGMSDRRYPIAVTLTVNGEQRSGCAEPL